MTTMGSSAAGVVMVFDFDRTIIEPDSDFWVVEELGVSTLFNQLLPTMPLNALMDRMMKELYAKQKTVEDIKEVLRRVAIHPRIVSAIKQAYSLGCDLRIVSDANTIFIDTILEHVGIKECFSEINTNPSYIDEHGRIKICPYMDFTSSSHGCNLCPPNMCKGMIIERIQASMSKEGNGRMIYLGDGEGDFCPGLKLNENDVMMPRKGFPVWDLICENRNLLRAQIREWTNGEELECILLDVLGEMMMSYNSSSVQTLSVGVGAKFVTASTAATALPEAALPPPVKVQY